MPTATAAPKTRRKAQTPTLARKARQAAELIKQASDATRLQILLTLAKGERNVGELCGDLGGMSQPALSHHLALLRHSGLIAPRRAGKNNFYQNTDKGKLLTEAVSGILSTL